VTHRAITIGESMARFVVRSSWQRMTERTKDTLKMCIVDALGCGIAAQDLDSIHSLRAHVEHFGGKPVATLIGGGQTAPDRAAL